MDEEGLKTRTQCSSLEATPRSQLIVFVLLCGLSLLLWWHALASTLQIALTEEADSHILLILVLAVALIYFEGRLSRPHSEPGVTLGVFLLAGALLIAGFARWGAPGVSADLRLSLSMFAIVIWWIASVIVCFGVSAFRRFLFPLCFLFWVVPAPAAVLNWIIPALQNESAVAARMFFQIARVPVEQDGTLLDIPGLRLDVAPECSSIRSSILLMVITMVLAHLFLRSWWRKALLIAAAIPLAVAKNGLRIFVIAELGTRVDRGFLHGNFHRHGGILFLGIAVASVVVLLWALHRWEDKKIRERAVR